MKVKWFDQIENKEIKKYRKVKISDLKNSIWEDFENSDALIKGISFDKLYNQLTINNQSDNKKVNVQSVFISLLHLCNEFCLELISKDGQIEIKKSI